MSRELVFSPAQHLLRAAIADPASTSDADALAHALALDGTGRGPLWQLLVAANLLPWAGFLLTAHQLMHRLDDAQRNCLEQAADTNAVRQALLVRHAVTLTRQLQARDISVLWMKGLWLSVGVLERPGTRYMEDIDLLVEDERFDEACDTLRAAGFALESPVDEPVPAASFCRTDNIPGSDGAVRVDLHHGIAAAARRAWDVDALWSSAVTRRVRGTSVMVPSLEAGLIMGALHAYKHGYDVRHLWTAIADAHAILRAAGDRLDVNWLEGRLEVPTVAVALYMLLRVAYPPGTVHDDSCATRLQVLADARVRALGERRSADRVLQQALRLAPIGAGDVSLMALAEEPHPLRAMAGLFSSARRRFVRDTATSADIGVTPVRYTLQQLSSLGAMNWRYAYATFLVGRLTARVARRGSWSA